MTIISIAHNHHTHISPSISSVIAPAGHGALSNHMPTAVDLVFKGQFGQQRCVRIMHVHVVSSSFHFAPTHLNSCTHAHVHVHLRQALRNLPIYISNPRLYHLLPKVPSAEKKIGGTGDSSIITMEPIEEETYENARFDPITQSWRAPFLLGDPHEFVMPVD